jgi:polysaccharide pyruvyl transferase WcaK-like protein
MTDRRQAMNKMMMLGGDADGNLGDRAILHAMCRSFRDLSPEVELVVVSRRPKQAGRVLRAEAIGPGALGFLPLCRAIRSSNVVVIGGGGLFQDDDSLLKMPYWAMRVLLVRLLGRPVIGYALGVGPLTSPLARACARLAFALMRTITVRDGQAQSVAQPLSSRPVEVVPDPAVGLSPAAPALARERLAAAGVPLSRRPIVGVALRRWFPPRPRLIPHRFARGLGLPDPQAGPEGERLLTLIARVLDHMVERHDAFVLFMPSYAAPHEADEALCRGVLARMARPRGCVLMLDDPALYKACSGELAVLLGGRMHPMILAAAMGTPVVGLAYNPKFQGFLAMLGEAGRCVDVVDLVRSGDPGPLVQLLDAAIRDRTRGRTARARELASRVRAFDRALLGALP